MDIDAAGRGSFIDPTPANDHKFDEHGAAIGGDAAEGVDLLTMLGHEFRHMLGWSTPTSAAT